MVGARVIYEYYGSTESSALTFANSDDAPAETGQPSAGSSMASEPGGFLSARMGDCLPQGEIGEIYSRVAGQSGFHLS